MMIYIWPTAIAAATITIGDDLTTLYPNADDLSIIVANRICIR